MNCKICSKQYSDVEFKPFTLIPCGHTFCVKCLEKLKTCPECDVNITGKLLNHAILEIINPNPLEWNDGTIYFDRYKKICFLEAGSYGSVYVFKDMQKDKIVALKTMQRWTMSEYASEELNILKKLDSPFVISYYDAFAQGDIFCILTEYCQGGNLSQRIRDKKRLKDKFENKTILHWTNEIINGIDYLHLSKVIHRDIKPGNVFLTDDGHIKLGDLGASRFIDEKYSTNMVSTFIGTLKYMSPEIRQHKKYTFSADIWSLGCVIFELITLEKFFDFIEPSKASIRFYCLKFKIKNNHEIFNKLQTFKGLKEVLKLALVDDLNKRADAKSLKETISAIDSNELEMPANMNAIRRKTWNILNFNEHSYHINQDE